MLYCYHVWETRHPRLLNGKPLYTMNICSEFPIETKEQIMKNLEENDPFWIIDKNKDFEVVPMSTKEYFKILFKEIISDTWEDISIFFNNFKSFLLTKF